MARPYVGSHSQPLEAVLVRSRIFAVSAAAVLIAPVLTAQGKPKGEQDVTVPGSAMPPEGMCRVWLRDVPERQQPAPTDCATALRTRPRNSILLFGDLSGGPLPPQERRLMSPAGAASRARMTELSRRSLFKSVDPRATAGSMTPTQALQAAEAAARQSQAQAAAAKLDPTKAAAVKRPDPPPQ